MKNIDEMEFKEILEFLQKKYGNDTTNLYIRCLECDEYIPITEWNEDLLDTECCEHCGYDEEE